MIFLLKDQGVITHAARVMPDPDVHEERVYDSG
jgi:hypothetical protein